MKRSKDDAAGDIEWFTHTRHCGRCGNPGEYCTCSEREPCGCREMHRMSSGLLPEALEAFADMPISDDQQELFS